MIGERILRWILHLLNILLHLNVLGHGKFYFSFIVQSNQCFLIGPGGQASVVPVVAADVVPIIDYIRIDYISICSKRQEWITQPQQELDVNHRSRHAK